MWDTIQKKLQDIESGENVRIIMAVESGSRAWGFASPDSDYDVRFIYIRTLEDYLKLNPMRDVIEWQLDDVLDINGWDVRKALQLLFKSNPTMFEWCASPIIYKTSEAFDQLNAIKDHYFSPKKSLFHYLHTAQSNYSNYLIGEEVKLKKYFYALRPILASKWIVDRMTPPPMLFSELAEAELEQELKPVVEDLIERKKTLSEIGTSKKIDVLNQYIQSNIEDITKIAENMKEEKTDWNMLDEYFLSLIS